MKKNGSAYVKRPGRLQQGQRPGNRKNNSEARIMDCRLKASFTIEAAVIVPLSMFIIITFMYIAFYMHDCVIMKTVGPYYILESADEYGSSLSGIEENTKEMLESRLIIAGDVSVNLEDDDGLWLECSAQFDLPFEFFRMLLKASSGSITTEIDISMLEGRDILLEYKALADTAESLTE